MRLTLIHTPDFQLKLHMDVILESLFYIRYPPKPLLCEPGTETRIDGLIIYRKTQARKYYDVS